MAVKKIPPNGNFRVNVTRDQEGKIRVLIVHTSGSVVQRTGDVKEGITGKR